MLRRVVSADIPNVQEVYKQASTFALSRGSTNEWDMNTAYCEKLIESGELYCREDEVAIRAAVRLNTQTNPLERPNGNENHLFIAKLATAESVRGRHYVPNAMMSEMEGEVRSRNMDGLRLNCFPDRDLMNFYEQGCGFTLLGLASFDSPTIGRAITTAKFEKAVA